MGTIQANESLGMLDVDLSDKAKGVYYMQFRRGEEVHVEKIVLY
jgi:hypothetical protein